MAFMTQLQNALATSQAASANKKQLHVDEYGTPSFQSIAPSAAPAQLPAATQAAPVDPTVSALEGIAKRGQSIIEGTLGVPPGGFVESHSPAVKQAAEKQIALNQFDDAANKNIQTLQAEEARRQTKENALLAQREMLAGDANAATIAAFKKMESDAQAKQGQRDQTLAKLTGLMDTDFTHEHDKPGFGGFIKRLAMGLGAAGQALSGGENPAAEMARMRAQAKATEIANRRSILSEVLGVQKQDLDGIYNLFGTKNNLINELTNRIMLTTSDRLAQYAKDSPPEVAAKLNLQMNQIRTRVMEERRVADLAYQRQAERDAKNNEIELAKQLMQIRQKEQENYVPIPAITSHTDGSFKALDKTEQVKARRLAAAYQNVRRIGEELLQLHSSKGASDSLPITKRNAEIKRLQKEFVQENRNLADVGKAFSINEEKLISPPNMGFFDMLGMNEQALKTQLDTMDKNMQTVFRNYFLELHPKETWLNTKPTADALKGDIAKPIR